MRITFTIVVCLVSATLFGQGSITVNSKKSKQGVALKPSIQVSVGSQGLGAGAKAFISDKITARLGVSILPFKSDHPYFTRSEGTRTHLDANFTNLHAFIDYALFPKKSIRIVGGVAHFFSAKGTMEVHHSPFKYGEITISEETMGNLMASGHWKGPALYGGIALFKNKPVRSKIYLNVDLGTYYLGSPSVSVIGTNMFVYNQNNESTLYNNMKNYRWMPVLQLNINYSFRK